MFCLTGTNINDRPFGHYFDRLQVLVLVARPSFKENKCEMSQMLVKVFIVVYC